MILFSICRKCPFGKFYAGKKDEDENFIYFPRVECEKAEEEIYLVMASEVPEECPHVTDHLIQCQDIDEDFARSLGDS
jgi:hypothetical protein